MSEQTKHALGQALIFVVLAALAALVEVQTGVLQSLSVPAVWWPIVGAVLAAAVRFLEGLRDANRAEEGKLVPADVGYDYALEKAKDPDAPDVHAIGNDIYVGSVINPQPQYKVDQDLRSMGLYPPGDNGI